MTTTQDSAPRRAEPTSSVPNPGAPISRWVDLDAIDARASSATPQPWEALSVPGPNANSMGYCVVEIGDREVRLDGAPGVYLDANFIAHARADVPDLAAQVRALRRVATGEIKHRYTYGCPDALDGHDRRDPLCAACKVLAATDPTVEETDG